MFDAVVILIVVGVLAALLKAIHAKVVAGQHQDAFYGDHRGWTTYVSSINHGLIAISPDSSQIAVGHGSNPKTYPITALATVEVLKDGGSITTTNRGSMAAGALIGELAFGSVGALLGGLSATKWNRNTINTIALKLIVDDRSAPVHSILFFESPSKMGTDVNSVHLKETLATVDRFHALLVTGMRKAVPPTSVQLPPPQKSASDELQKLWELKQAGALTEDEFSAHKARLLSN